MDNRIVVTGIGVISSIGIGREKFWEALIKGTSGISEIESFDTSAYPTHRAGEIKNFRAEEFIPEAKAQKLGRASCLAIAAAKLALQDACLKTDNLDPQRSGVALGTTMAESQVLEKLNDAWVKKGEAAIDVDWIPRFPPYVLPNNLAREFNLQGPNYIIPTACAAGNYAIGYAFDLLRKGKVDVMLAGGVDAFSRIAFMGFNRLLAIAPQICQPFDKNRKGMMVAEGAAILVLEPLENALKRSCPIYAEILGYGLSCDAHHMTAPHASGIALAIEKSLRESGLKPEDIAYISAHGTGTPANDREECLAIHKVLGEYTGKIPISSIKSMLGHTMGAASAIEAAACCLVTKFDLVPPTINFQTPDPDCAIDCVPNSCRRQKVNVALNNAFAFGGNNSCLALKKFIPA